MRKLACFSFAFAAGALLAVLELPAASCKKDLLQAMSGHVLQTGEVIGWYQP